jgi:hypothetical protein
MIIKEMTDEQLGKTLNYYVDLIKSPGGDNDVNLKKLDEIYGEIIDRKLQSRPAWM